MPGTPVERAEPASHTSLEARDALLEEPRVAVLEKVVGRINADQLARKPRRRIQVFSAWISFGTFSAH